MAKRDFAFGKENFILIAIAVVVIIIGFVLMSGGGSEDGVSFNPEIFSTRRIVIAPLVTFLGFALMIVAVLKKSKDKPE
jgi:preprotein translocase subunit SecG